MHVTWSGNAIPGETGRIPVRDVLAVSRHAAGTAIEEWAALRIFSIMCPVIVWKGALVAALLPQHLLKSPGEIAMP